MSLPPSIRHAWRSLRRTLAFSVTATLTLVIGIAASVAIFAVVDGVILRPLPYGSPHRLVGAWHDLPPIGLTHAQQTASTYFTYKRLARGIEGIGVYQDGSANVSQPGSDAEPQRVTSAWISADLLPVLKVPLLLGRNFTPDEDRGNGPPVVIIGEAMWRNRFGADRAAVGKLVEVNGVRREIVGVMPERFRFPVAGTQLWLPLGLDPADPFPGGFNYNAVARLKPGITVADAQRDFAAVLPRVVELFPTFAPGISTQMLLDQTKPVPVLTPLKQDVIGDVARTLWMIAGAAGLVLLVAAANVANLILVRADGRQRELAVREALGAGRGRVLLHFFTESALLAGVAGVLGLGAATLAVRALVHASPVEIPRLAEVGIGGREVIFALGVALAVALGCSIIPALRIGRVHLSNALREGGRSGTGGRAQHRLRGAMVAVQIALALVVLAGSGLLLRSFQRLHAIEPGFQPQQVATFWMSAPNARYGSDTAQTRFYQRVLERVAQVPGVQSAGLSSRLPLESRGMNSNPYYPEGDASYAEKIPPLQLFTTTDGAYFRTMGIPLIAGRTFDRLDLQHDLEAIISRRTAQQFYKDSTGRAALGKRFRELPSGPWYTVVGVVGDVRDTALAVPPPQIVYFPQVPARDPNFGHTRSTMALVVRTAGDPAAITVPVQRALRELDPTIPTFDVRPMAVVLRGSMARLSFVILILGAAAAVTLLLGAIGLYGVMAYVVTLRSKELGVRIALGATPQSVAAMMTGQGLVLTAIGIGGGLALFAVVARALRSFLFGVAPSDPLTLAVASLMLVAIAMLASWIPARRAGRVDPAEALRAE